MMYKTLLASLVFGLTCLGGSTLAQSLTKEDARRAVSILDYISRDYTNAVDDEGKILNPAEFEEMKDFGFQVQNYLGEIPEVFEMRKQIDAKAKPSTIKGLTKVLRDRLMTEHGITTSPDRLPNLVQGKKIYEQSCASCHGVDGNADTFVGKNMIPPASKLSDPALLDQLSPFQAFNTITYGLVDTAMASFSSFPEEDRWALASYVFTLRPTSKIEVAPGEKSKIDWKETLGRNDSEIVAGLTEIGVAQAELMRELALVRNFAGFHADLVVSTHVQQSLDLSQRLLKESYQAYVAGDAKLAFNRAVSSYIDGFEKVESILIAKKQGDLMMKVEASFLRYRKAISGGTSTEVEETYQATSGALTSVKMSLLENQKLGKSSAFLGSFVIVFREGLEALLLVSIILSCLGKAGARHLGKWVHVSWVCAIVAGIATWFIASNLISGTSREIAEGWISLLACAVLIYVSFWILSKKDSQKWIEYLTGKLKRGSTISYATVFSVAFFAVYREMFETILFMEALKLQSGDGTIWIVLGIVSALVTLFVVAQFIFYFGKKMPFHTFFSVSGHLLYILAVIFMGQGMHSMGEAGLLSLTPVRFVTIPNLGVFPYLETLLAQLSLLLVYVVSMFLIGSKKAS